MPLAASVRLRCGLFFASTQKLKRVCGPRSLASLGGLNMQVTAILASVEVRTGPMFLPHMHVRAGDPFKYFLPPF